MTPFSLLHTLPAIAFAVSFPLSPAAFSMDSTAVPSWSFVPDGGPMLQLHQNPEEPRTGIRKEIGSSRMRLDVGTNFEVVGFSASSADHFRLGLQIFAYALTVNNQGLRLQIDALDGFFGGHITWRRTMGSIAVLGRLRILHHSAHFVDGHIDASTGTWIDGRAPVPYTKDFGELLGGIDTVFPLGHIRIYGGASYATLVRPTDIGRVGGMVGIDYRTDNSTFSALGHPFLLYAGYQLNLTEISSILGTNAVEAGIKFGAWEATGVRIFTSYHAGPEVFGQYYNVKRTYWEIGFALDLL